MSTANIIIVVRLMQEQNISSLKNVAIETLDCYEILGVRPQLRIV